MNSTPKDRVKARYPRAFLEKKKRQVALGKGFVVATQYMVVADERRDPDTGHRIAFVLGSAGSPQKAWEEAARELEES